MKTNFSLKFKFFDIFILAFVVVAIVASIIATNVIFGRVFSNENNVEIYYHNQLIKEIKLDEITEETKVVLKQEDYEKLLGDLTVLIDPEKGICISEVTCPNHTCIKQGWVNKVGYPVTCLPNGVYVMITSPSPDVDLIT